MLLCCVCPLSLNRDINKVDEAQNYIMNKELSQPHGKANYASQAQFLDCWEVEATKI